jgi:hypothetical protein
MTDKKVTNMRKRGKKMLFQKGEKPKVQMNRYAAALKKDIKTIDCQINKKNKRTHSLRHKFFLFSPMNGRNLSGKVSFYSSFSKLKKASIAVETAVVLPIFFFGIITMISFMDIYKIQTEHLSKLCQEAKQAGMWMYIPGRESEDEITIPDVYKYKPVGCLIPFSDIVMFNVVKVHAWTGMEYSDFQDGEEVEPMVYVTESGSVYHKNLGCSYLNISVNQISGYSIDSTYNEKGEHYTACEICSKNQSPAGLVYVTKKGNRYHNEENCSGLKRSVRMVKESDVSNMGACSRCGQGA